MSDETFLSAASPAPSETEQPPSLADVWQDTLAGLRLHLPREVYGTCVRQLSLIEIADDIATIGISDPRLKGTLEFGYLSALRLALGDALGREAEVRMVIHRQA